MSLSKLQELVMDREACPVAVHRVAKSRPRLWLNWTELWPWSCTEALWGRSLPATSAWTWPDGHQLWCMVSRHWMDSVSPSTERSFLISCLYHQMPARLLEVAWHTGKKAWLEEAPRQESADPKVWGIFGCSSLSPRTSCFFPLWANCWEARSEDCISGWKATGECTSQEQCKADCGSKLSGATCK